MANHTGPSSQTDLFTTWVQTRCKTGHGSHIWFQISMFLSRIYVWQRQLCLYHMTLGQVSITLHGTHRVPLKDCDREQVTIRVQMAWSYSLSTCWGDSGKRTPGSREGLAETLAQGSQETSKWPSWLRVPRHVVYLHFTSSWTIKSGSWGTCGTELVMKCGNPPLPRCWQHLHRAQAAGVQGYTNRFRHNFKHMLTTIIILCTSLPFDRETKALNGVIHGSPIQCWWRLTEVNVYRIIESFWFLNCVPKEPHLRVF